MFENVPDELKEYAHWLVWKGEIKENGKLTKIPLQTANGFNADVTNPSHWSTFEKSLEIVRAGYADGIGFCLNCSDPYTVIDLDDTEGNEEHFQRQLKIYETFNSYSEISPSGKGLHIVCKGSLEKGRRRDHVELYSRDRFITFSGNVYNNAPIAHRQELLDVLWAEMGAPPRDYEVKDGPQKLSDEEILDKIFKAVNGEKAQNLFNGNWQGFYSSQSEADFSLIDIIAFYTQNLEQIKRLFRRSNLGKRAKAFREDYVGSMIQRSFDRQLPEVDIEGLRIQIEAMKEGAAAIATATPSTPHHPASEAQAATVRDDEQEARPTSSIAAANLIAQKLNVKMGVAPEKPSGPEWPPGLLGEIAQFIFQAAPRPVYEMALAGAIGFMAGICGRSYNISGTGLNQYVLVLGQTGSNKESIASGISKLMLEVKAQVPSAMTFIGPGEIRSDAGLIKWISKNPCFTSIVGEFGYRFQQMTANSRNPYEVGLKRVMLDLYNKSGKGSALSPMAYSDKDKNTDFIYSPSFSILGEGTPETFYAYVDENVIYDGLLPRFLIIEYKGSSPSLSKNHMYIKPSKQLVDRLCTIASYCLSQNQNNQVVDVQTTPEAEIIFDDLETRSRYIINNSKEIGRQLWNRVHIKTLKLAALMAVGINPWNPVIDKFCANWALNLVIKDTKNIFARFDGGKVGETANTNYSSDSNQLDEMVKLIKRWITKEEVPSRGDERMVALNMYFYSSLQTRLSCVASYRRDRNGSDAAIKKAFQSLLNAGDIEELNPLQIQKEFGRKAKSFRVVDIKRFLNADSA